MPDLSPSTKLKLLCRYPIFRAWGLQGVGVVHCHRLVTIVAADISSCLVQNGWRTQQAVSGMSAADQRNTAILELSQANHATVSQLQAMSEAALCSLCPGTVRFMWQKTGRGSAQCPPVPICVWHRISLGGLG